MVGGEGETAAECLNGGCGLPTLQTDMAQIKQGDRVIHACHSFLTAHDRVARLERDGLRNG